MQLGFLIDHTRCIGCHACTVACKAENDVPVGNFRTWVKYTEKGTYPAVKRTFAVLRCNQCTKPPCVTICPVNALSKGPKGIVDIDRDACIGCRACMQACPYDAIYLNEDDGCVEKCHFCAHRVEKNLAPACAVVCPAEAIIHGDLHDPDSVISRYMSGKETVVRRPEQDTGPNVHYLGVEPIALVPGQAVRLDTFLWSERPPHKQEAWPADLPVTTDARTVLDVGHHVEWRWQVAAYLVTKGIAAGAGIIAPFLGILGVVGFAAAWLPELVALVFTGITTVLLVEDLTRPTKFLTILTRPNPRSWLARGAWILIAYSGVAGIILAARLFGLDWTILRWLEAPLGLAVAGYTAFLFQQCEGRDLWQSRWVLATLLAQAVAFGGAVYAWASPTAAWVGAVALTLATALTLAESFLPHVTLNARQAAAFLRSLRTGPLPALPLAVGTALIAIPALVTFGPLGAVLTCIAIYLWEDLFVRAGQLPPLS